MLLRLGAKSCRPPTSRATRVRTAGTFLCRHIFDACLFILVVVLVALDPRTDAHAIRADHLAAARYAAVTVPTHYCLMMRSPGITD